MATRNIQIHGRTINTQDQQGIPGLHVEAWDKDALFDDMVGSAVTDEKGEFRIEFTEAYYKECFLDRHPDLFFKVFHDGRLICSTEESVIWNLKSPKASVVIEVDFSGGRQPDAGAYRIQGTVLSRFTGLGIPGLRVEARDLGKRIPEAIGTAMTNARGQFQIQIPPRYQKEIAGRQPDIFFRVYSGQDLLISTENSLLWNVKRPQVQVTISVDLVMKGDEGQSPPEVFTVRGRVAKPDGAALPGLQVIAFQKSANGRERQLGMAQSDEGGFYAIHYTLEQLANPAKGSADLIVRVYEDPSAAPVASSPLILNALAEEVINFSVGEEVYRGRSEYEVVAERLRPLVDQAENREFSDQDVAYLSNSTGLTLKQVQLYLESRKQSRRAGVEAAALYALYRTGMPYSLAALTVQNPETLVNKLQQAQDKNIIPPIDNGAAAKVVEGLKALRARELLETDAPARLHAARLFDLAGLSGGEKDTVLDVYSRTSGPSESFWENLRQARGISKEKVEKLQKLFAVNALSLNHLPLVEALTARREIPSLKELAARDKDAWKAFLEEEGISAPEQVPGNTETEKRENYALMLSRIMEDTFPTAYFSSGWLRDESLDPDIKTFFTRHPEFAFEEKGINTFLKDNPEALEGFQDKASTTFKLQALQNLFRLGPRFDRLTVVKALWQDRIYSAYEIKRMGEEKFVARYEPILGPARARAVFADAEKIAGFSLLTLARFAWDTNGVTPYTIPKTSLTANPNETARATLSELFGNLDFCHCRHCRSVLGPPAYLVDLLAFLNNATAADGETGLQKLFARRPDIGELELSCENTSKQVPYIDLVNEVLEDEISPLPVYTLSDTFVIHLEAGRIKPELRSALDSRGLSVSEEATVSVIESGRIWAIQDGFGYYKVHLDGAQLNIKLSRQTFGTPAELRAHPGYLNAAAYEILKTARYPWSLPFDLWAEEARTYLGQLGVRRYELMQIFRRSDAASPSRTDILSEALGITPAERTLLTRAVTGEAELKELWGVRSGSLIDAVKNVETFLARAGIRYEHLEALLQCRFINPDLNAADAVRLSFDEDHACSLAHAELTNLNLAKLDKMHRFIRLANTLGWSFFDLDKALTAFDKADIDEEFLNKLSLVIQLKDRFGTDLPTALSWWALKLDTTTYKDTPSQYDELFRNRAVGELKEDVRTTFTLDATGGELSVTDQSMLHPDYEPVILGAARITRSDLDLIITEDLNGDATLHLGSISHVIRVASFCQAVGLPIQEYYLLRKLTGLEPLSKPGSGASPALRAVPEDTLAFIESRQTAAASGLSLSELAYLLAHDTSQPNNGQLPQQIMAQRLSDMRTDLAAIFAAHQMPADENLESVLMEKLGNVLESEALRIQGLQIVLDQSTLPEADQKSFIETYFATFLEDVDQAKQKLVGPGPDRITEIRERLVFVLTPLLEYLYRRQAEQYLNQKLTESLSLSADAAAGLLQRVKNPDDTTETARDVLLEETFVTGSETLDPATHPAHFKIYERLYKASRFLNGLNIVPDDQAFVVTQGDAVGWPDISSLPLSSPADASALHALYSRFVSLVRAFQTWPRIRTSGASFSEFLRAITQTGISESQIIRHLADHSAWAVTDIQTLITNYGFSVNDLQKTDWLVQLYQAFSVLKRLGVGAAQAWSWNTPDVSAEQAARMKLAAKSRYDNQEWLSIAPTLRDPLREKQRDALLAYLIQEKGYRDADDVYAHLLIDPEMSACRDSSRMVLAISSVQLFVQRILMNLEADEIEFTYADAKQWQWRKNYRVWEANRKVFLWPENWIFSDLRYDKSPFFKELEEELLQSDIDNESAERALMSYLKKLDEVAHLEVSGLYEEIEEDTNQYILHVVARTHGTPHKYFYRRWLNRQYWTAWERVEADIEGDHLIPVVHNRRLFLFWPKFIEKAVEVRGSRMTDVREAKKRPDDPKKYYEIHIAWTQYRDGKWRETQVSTDFFRTHPSSRLRNKQEYYFFAEKTEQGELLLRCRLIPPETIKHGKTARSLEELLTVLYYNDITDSIQIYEPARVLPGFAARHLYLNKIPDGDNFNMWFEKTADEQTFSLLTNAKVNAYGEFIQLANKKEAELLTSAPAGFRVMLPQQYPTYVSQAPCFYSDTSRSYFIVPRSVVRPLYDGGLDFGLRPPEFTYFWDTQTVLNNKWLSMLDQVTWINGTAAKKDGAFFDAAKGYYVGNSAGSMVIDRAAMTPAADSPYAEVIVNPQISTALQPRGDFSNPAAPLFSAPTGPQWIKPSDFQLSMDREMYFSHLSRQGWDYWLSKQYRFHVFYHPYVPLMIRQVNRYGVEGLYAPSPDHRGRWNGADAWMLLKRQQALQDRFVADYAPNGDVVDISDKYRPREDFDFSFRGAYSQYNWELFFHIPLLIAERLMQNQKFEQAQKWFHYIFNPTETEGEAPKRFWQIKPFYEYDQEASIERLIELLNEGDEEIEAQVEAWENDPFNPHLIASMRTVAYMRTTVMKYIDNLIAWGDSLFRRFSTESLNEATQLYVLAAQILGRKPERVEKTDVSIYTFNDLLPRLDEFSNARVAIESSLPWMTSHKTAPSTGASAILDTLYFCIPQNEKLLGYWDTVADRLFKIRHCMDIEGVLRQPALFEPPIDPGLLVKARAMGLELSSILSDLSAPLPHYRFRVILQRANEFCADVKSLGMALLQALEKRDAETLALLRSTHQVDLLKALRELKERAVEEARHTRDALIERKQMAEIRFKHYDSLDFMNPAEITGVALSGASILAHSAAITADILAGIMFLIPNFQIGASGFGGTPHVTAKTGGDNVGKSVERGANGLYQAAAVLEKGASLAYTIGSYLRRQEEWDLQRDLADKEMDELEKQILAAEMRMEIAQSDLNAHELQTEQSETEAAFLESKFTNKDLYNWMVSQIATLYFQTYQMAYELAKKAEQCFRHELGIQESHYIQFGYWDSLKKGLLAGERLQKDLRRLELAFLELHRREFELTKHISLAQLNPVALLQLKQTGTCEFTIPEVLFDLDYPGHYMRRIKSVSLTIPCVVGPYTTVAAKLTLLENRIRTSTAKKNNKYAYQGLDDERFVHDLVGSQSIATSSGQQDAGLFELNFGDERYLPFEGAGAVSRWRLELPENYHQFDYNTITDVIIHVQYTAREGGGVLKALVQSELLEALNKIADILAAEQTGLTRIISARHEFSNEWHRFLYPAADASTQALNLNLSKALLPYLVQNKSIHVQKITAVLLLERPGDYADSQPLAVTLKLPDGGRNSADMIKDPELAGLPAMGAGANFVLSEADHPVEVVVNESDVATLPAELVVERNGKKRLNPDAIADMLVVLHYTLSA